MSARAINQLTGQRLEGEITLGPLIGQGASGAVYRATHHDGQPIAVKIMAPSTGLERGRLQREVDALKRLQIPGVVQLLGEGEHDGLRYLIMSLVEGTPFPGSRARESRPGRWGDILNTVISMLEILQRVHDAGFTHRDLKPANVLVDAEGWPTLLDFGVARVTASGHTLTQEGALVGTPYYLSPEQLTGAKAGAASDLYAVGVMLYEHLAGRLPIDGADVQILMRRKMLQDAPPLSEHAPHAPAHVCNLVDALLRRAPEDRPASAREAVAMLRRGASLGGPLPWLGDRDPIERLTASALAGRPIDISGPSGCGRTRLIDEACEALLDAGLKPIHLIPGGSPLASLAPLIPPSRLEDPALLAEGMQGMLRHIDEMLRGHLAEGVILIADPVEALDRWTAGCLARLREGPLKGCLIRVLPEHHPADITLTALSEINLRPLFEGPDRVLHLVEDGARVLFNRTGGVPRLLTAEIVDWLGAGLASWEGESLRLLRSDLLRLTRRPLSRIREDAPEIVARLSSQTMLEDKLGWITLAWPHTTVDRLATLMGTSQWALQMEIEALVEMGAARVLGDGRVEPRVPATALQRWSPGARQAARRTLIETLPLGAEGRLDQVIALGEPALILEEALARQEVLVIAGDLESAHQTCMAAIEALIPKSGAPRVTVEALWPSLRAMALVACKMSSLAALDTAREILSRCLAALPGPGALWDLDHLLRALQAAHRGDAEEARGALARAPEYADDPDLCWRRHETILRLAMSESLEATERTLEALAALAEGAPDHLRGQYATWQGIAAYRRGDHRGSAQWHGEAAARRQGVVERLSAQINVALNLLEVPAYDEAMTITRALQAEASDRRLTSLEAYAEYIVRSIQIREGSAEAVDWSLIEAVRALGDTDQLLGILIQEAALALRLDDADEARHLAEEVIEIAGAESMMGLIGRALIYAAGAPRTGEDAFALGDALQSRLPPKLALQTLGLLAEAAPDPRWRTRVQPLYDLIPEAQRTLNFGICSADEALAATQ